MNGVRMVSHGALAAAGMLAVGAGAAHAQDAVTVAYNVGVTSDYVFRGISQSDGDVAVQGGVDVASGMFYGGVWASMIDFGLDENAEVDFYAGVKPMVGPIMLDFGLIYYMYPGLDDSYNGNYLEAKAAATVPATDQLTLGAAIYWSPGFTFTDDEAGIYAEVTAAFKLNDVLTLSGGLGHQDVDVDGYYVDVVDGPATEKYTTWNVGLAYTEGGFTLDGRIYDTDLDEVAVRGPGGDTISDQRVVGSVKFAF